MKTIDELKQAVLDREAKCQAEQEAAALAKQASLENLKAWLAAESPLGAYPYDLSDWSNAGRTAVRFHVDGHADILAVFDFNPYENTWQQIGLAATYSVPRWRVFRFTGVERDTEDDGEHYAYYPRYRHTDFEDLGEALLEAERAFVDPAQIGAQRLEANAKREQSDEARVEILLPMPEPDEGTILLDAIKRYVDAQMDIRATESAEID